MEQKEIELYNKYSNNMETAYKYQYARAIPHKDMIELINIYHKYNKDKRLNTNVNCSVCQLNILKELYKFYQSNFTENNNNETKKRGRKKK